MYKAYTPLDWYWLKPDGQSVFGSRHQTIVEITDPDYVAWSESGGSATLWPKDETGAQTDAAMQAVLTPLGLSLPGITVVPASVSSAQAKIMASRTPGAESGKTLLDDITAAVVAAGIEAQIWFSEARTWERQNPYVLSLSNGLGLTSAKVDALFVDAAKIPA